MNFLHFVHGKATEIWYAFIVLFLKLCVYILNEHFWQQQTTPSTEKKHFNNFYLFSLRLRLRSSSSDQYKQPQMGLKFGQQAFSYTAPHAAAWSSATDAATDVKY